MFGHHLRKAMNLNFDTDGDRLTAQTLSARTSGGSDLHPQIKSRRKSQVTSSQAVTFRTDSAHMATHEQRLLRQKCHKVPLAEPNRLFESAEFDPCG